MTLQEILQLLHDEDPDFGKVNNDSPADEFAFEIPGGLRVGQVSALSEAEAAQQITAVDDYGRPVFDVPLGQTCRALSFHFCGRTVKLPFSEECVPVAVFIHTTALLLVHYVCERPDRFDCGVTSKKAILELRQQVLDFPFYRFYYDRTEGWWEVVFDTFSKGRETTSR